MQRGPARPDVSWGLLMVGDTGELGLVLGFQLVLPSLVGGVERGLPGGPGQVF